MEQQREIMDFKRQVKRKEVQMSAAQPLPIGFLFFLETSAIGFAKITCKSARAFKMLLKRCPASESNDLSRCLKIVKWFKRLT